MENSVLLLNTVSENREVYTEGVRGGPRGEASEAPTGVTDRAELL